MLFKGRNQMNEERKFDSEEAARVLGITAGTLQAWLARGIVRLANANPGRGKVREYTRYEITRMQLMRKLSMCGMELGAAFRWTAKLADLFENADGAYDEWGKDPIGCMWLVVSPADANPELKGRPDIRLFEGFHIAFPVMHNNQGEKSALVDTINHLSGLAMSINISYLLADTSGRLESLK
jgi:hypothetical protein